MKTALKSFGPAAAGITWAVRELPGGIVNGEELRAEGLSISLAPLKGAHGADDYALKFKGSAAVSVQANSAAGIIYGLLRLGELVRAGERRNVAQRLQFRTRNYKHEIWQGEGQARAVQYYTEEWWETLCRQIVRHQFNGLVLYPGYHPFEVILDYKEWPKAAEYPAEYRARIRKALQTGTAVAHRYGLKTFMQHYVNHFTRALADEYKIPIGSRLSSIDHPIVDEYTRWCYREIFKQVPDLDGLYFNFESTNNAHAHVIRTAIHEFKKMARKPIMVFRLWGFSTFEGLRQMLKAYNGRIIVSHKISDTNDTYYLPVADSRAGEWKKALGSKLEWMYCLGPCHNCGTNLCDQLWGDYEFAHALVSDAKKQGADSISFHTVNCFFSPDCPNAGSFSQKEKDLARHNYLHLRAIADFFNNRKLKPAEQARLMAERLVVPAAAGKPLVEAIKASSQLVLLTYQQFFFSGGIIGYLNPGRISHIQEPFMYFPATEVNNQARTHTWRLPEGAAWITKQVPRKVAPDNLLQRIIDYVNPSQAKAVRNPKVIADLLRENIGRSFQALKEYRKIAGREAADTLEKYLRNNAALGEYVRHEILAAIELYSIYFAQDKAAVVRGLRKGLGELKALRPYVADRNSPSYKSLARTAMLDRLDVEQEIGFVEEALRLIEAARFPWAAFAAYVESHRLYNEIRREVIPFRIHDQLTIAAAGKRLKPALAKAQEALAALSGPEHRKFADNVWNWNVYLQRQLAQLARPEIECAASPGGRWHRLKHESCFRQGEHFALDFSSFIKPVDYVREGNLYVRVWRTPGELAVSFKEDRVDPLARVAWWRKWKGSGSDLYVTQFQLDAGSGGRQTRQFTLWPEAASLSVDLTPNVKARKRFEVDRKNKEWRATVWVPFKVLGRTPKQGEVWGLNFSSNPYIARARCYSWASNYDSNTPEMFGRLKFV